MKNVLNYFIHKVYVHITIAGKTVAMPQAAFTKWCFRDQIWFNVLQLFSGVSEISYDIARFCWLTIKVWVCVPDICRCCLFSIFKPPYIFPFSWCRFSKFRKICWNRAGDKSPTSHFDRKYIRYAVIFPAFFLHNFIFLPTSIQKAKRHFFLKGIVNSTMCTFF